VTKRPGLLRRRRYNRLSDDVQIGASCWLCSGVRSILIGSSPRTSLIARTTPTLVAKIVYYNETLLALALMHDRIVAGVVYLADFATA